jgi:hypothetical protein
LVRGREDLEFILSLPKDTKGVQNL